MWKPPQAPQAATSAVTVREHVPTCRETGKVCHPSCMAKEADCQSNSAHRGQVSRKHGGMEGSWFPDFGILWTRKIKNRL